MKQFANVSHTVMLFTALLLALETWTLAADAPKAAARPNILLIYTDDRGWADLGLQGVDHDIRTPHFDRLAQDGVRFTRGYVTAPQCVPSRAGVITGRYQQRFGVEDNNKGPLPLSELTIAERLKPAGYISGWVGKIRLEPTWMNLCESAGHAAALAIQQNVTPAALDPDLLLRKLAASHVMLSFFNDVDVASDDPRVAAAQYFGTKGFLAGYDAKLDAPLTEAVKVAWQEGIAELQKGTLEPMQLAQAVHAAEARESTACGQKRGDFLLAEFNRIKQSR